MVTAAVELGKQTIKAF